MALLQGAGGGGGGAPMPAPGGAPPPMPGGAPGPGGAPPVGAMLQKIQELMQSPAARQGMMQFAQQSGMIPGGGGGGAPPQGGMPPGMPAPAGGSPPPPAMDVPPGQEQDMVSQEIDRKGATFDGVDAPTQNDIERLQADPTSVAIKAFDEQFGEGAAEKYLEEEKGESPDKEQGEGDTSEADPSDAKEY